jgi:shikimate kinase
LRANFKRRYTRCELQNQLGSHSHNLILTGFMGTGKTTAGRQVARRLGRPFVDMDALIETRAGRTITQIFEGEGEPHFRKLERRLCQELATRNELVIATGGGTLVDADNLATMTASGLVVCLNCRLDVLWERLVQARDRPLLDAANRRAQVVALLAQRQAAYWRIALRVDTTERSMTETVAEILRIWENQGVGSKE